MPPISTRFGPGPNWPQLAAPSVLRARREGRGELLLLSSAIAGVCAVCALVATIGADSQWLAALGRSVAAERAIPTGVPFAAAPTAQWPNTIALAELIFHWLEAAAGDRGLMLAGLLAVGIGLTITARDAVRSGATAAGAAMALVIAAIGAFPSLAIARDQLFSLVLFPLVVALLRQEARFPSRRIWLVPVILAVWANLHGGVLFGLGLTVIYLIVERRREDARLALAVGLAALVAVCVTPGGLRTVSYYHGVLTNVAAQRGEAQWSALSLGSPADLLLIVAALGMSLPLLRRWQSRPALWELASITCLVVLTVSAIRSGVWLLLFLVPPVACALAPKRDWRLFHLPLLAGSLAAIGFAVARGPIADGASARLITQAMAAAHGSPVLAQDLVAEQVALAGGRVWLSNPIDAFSKSDQAVYLDWTEGIDAGRRALRGDVRAVLVTRGSPADRLMARTTGFVATASDRTAQLYLRDATGRPSIARRASAPVRQLSDEPLARPRPSSGIASS
jgi:hypothetical protein